MSIRPQGHHLSHAFNILSTQPSRPANPVDARQVDTFHCNSRADGYSPYVGCSGYGSFPSMKPSPSLPSSPSPGVQKTQVALYSFPALWSVLLIVSIFKFNMYVYVPFLLLPEFADASMAMASYPCSSSFLPIVGLALVFNITNAVGFTYA